MAGQWQLVWCQIAVDGTMSHLCVTSRREPGYTELQVSKFALQAVASPRTIELARAKRLHPDYMPPRDAQWPVSKAAKQAVATPRLVELAQPRKRPPMDLTHFNPDAFTVKESAKKATCSARIQELARPIKR
ncbi:sperm microtubule associated protein 2-like isoform X1 [Anas platyrhynchos]|uniref:sperm microtubule associated protein 2-like isoform X1 n=1 Tax=Anas platyrhynchos TaxID=8839 RepID=UPI00065E0824